MTILLATAKRYLDRKGKLVVFIGNEYDLLADKIRFLHQTKAEYVCSQLPIQSAKWLYSECPETQVLGMPHALNPELYKPTENNNRKIDLGFRGMAYPIFIGDVERQDMLDYFSSHDSDLGLRVDIRYEKLDRREWAAYLQTCKGIIGAEAGSYFLNKAGMSISLAKKYLRTHPQVTLKEIQALFFEKSGPYITGKAISSRHFEAIGTKTCQVLLEGNYNEILKPDIHYISMKKDFSNIRDVVDRFQDDDYRNAMVERTYEYIVNAHTYRHRVEYLINSIAN
jgi:spore maturation protein CgeB